MNQTSLSLRLLAATASLALLAACTTDPFTGERQVSKTAAGAVLGAGAGAAIGAISGEGSAERKKRALIGAGAGALAGGAVGAYMDIQEAKLRERLAGTGVSVTRVGDNIILNMPGNVTFETDRADIRPNFFGVLNSVSLVLGEYEKTVIEIAGHTDSTGSDQYNLDLSARRALSVKEYLRSQNIPETRLVARAFGETRPIASNDTPQGRQQNRRVELTLLPLTM